MNLFGRTTLAALVAGSTVIAGVIAGASVSAQTASPAVVTGSTVSVSAEAQAIRDAVVATLGDGALLEVYQQHAFDPVWTDDKLAALRAALADAPAHGLPVDRYDLSAADALPLAERDVAYTQVFLTFARDINSGLLEPRSVDRNIVVRPKRPDPAALLEGMILAPDAAGFMAALPPAHPHYVDLLAEKQRLERLIEADTWGPTVPTGSTLREGDSGPRVLALRARLARMGLGQLIISEENTVADQFDETLADALRQFQIRHGLNDDAVLGPKTLEAVNTQPDVRLRQVLVNLERQRWYNYDRGDRHVYVNQADFSVQIIDSGASVFFSRTVIGKNRHQTQEFNDMMTHMVINPTWHVPRSIATEEMLPRLKNNPTALGGSMQIMTRSGIRVNPALVDFTQYTAGNFPFIVKQRPGGGNALGRVKFMFPNEFNIYLHDTPSKSLFNRDVRAYSHGCVRVQKPFEFAYALLSEQTADPKGTFDAILGAGRERQVNLDTPLPVYLTYQSAWVDTEGTPQYRADVYVRDGRVFGALADLGVTLGLVEG